MSKRQLSMLGIGPVFLRVSAGPMACNIPMIIFGSFILYFSWRKPPSNTKGWYTRDDIQEFQEIERVDRILKWYTACVQVSPQTTFAGAVIAGAPSPTRSVMRPHASASARHTLRGLTVTSAVMATSTWRRTMHRAAWAAGALGWPRSAPPPPTTGSRSALSSTLTAATTSSWPHGDWVSRSQQSFEVDARANEIRFNRFFDIQEQGSQSLFFNLPPRFRGNQVSSREDRQLVPSKELSFTYSYN